MSLNVTSSAAYDLLGQGGSASQNSSFSPHKRHTFLSLNQVIIQPVLNKPSDEKLVPSCPM